jgi:hypothetical protein
MLLIIILGLIAKLTSVSGNCEVGTRDVKYFDWYQVCISVLTRFLKDAAFKTTVSLLYFIFIYIKFAQEVISDLLSSY